MTPAEKINILKARGYTIAGIAAELGLTALEIRRILRKGNDAGRFHAAMEGTIGKRLTYRVLTQQGDAGFMGIQ